MIKTTVCGHTSSTNRWTGEFILFFLLFFIGVENVRKNDNLSQMEFEYQ